MQQFISRLFKRLLKSWSWILLIVGAIVVKWVSLYPDWIERNYTYGVYPVIAKVQRFLLGWIPFSIGDIFYLFLILVLVFRVVKFFRLLLQRKLNRFYFAAALQQFIFLILFVYVFFNVLWGLNYNRVGIAQQLELKVQKYSTQDLDTLVNLLHDHLNYQAGFINEESRDSFHRKSALFSGAAQAFASAAPQFTFLNYTPKSVKPSLYSYIGNYLGFQGYYNPFSGEAQVNTYTPASLHPFVATHEIAHQLGYAKENEANFVGFLACRTHPSPVFKYSVYFDMYNYASRELARRDTALYRHYQQALHPQVINDIEEYRAYLRKYRNPLESVMTWGYGHFLKANNQPSGFETYSEVVAWLIAYYKKYGKEVI